MANKTIFITGGTGFLGQALLKNLMNKSVKLIGLARSKQSKEKLEAFGVEVINGSLENINDWASKLSGVDIVVHLAAPVEFWGPWQKYKVGIVDATTQLFIASEKHHVSQFIYISSESVLQDKKSLMDINETEPYPEEPNSFYGKSKMLAEKFILSQNSKMKSIILRPTFIWGNGVTALKTIISKINSNDFMWINHGKSWFEMVHVDNVAHAIYLAIVQGTNNDKEIYFVTDDNPQTVRSFLTKLIHTQQVQPPTKSIPKGLALFFASIFEWVWKTIKLKSAPQITRFDVAFVAMDRKYDISKIKTELEYAPIINEQKGLNTMKRVKQP